MRTGVLITRQLAEKLKRIPDARMRDLVGERRRVDVAAPSNWLIPARVTAVQGGVNATYDVQAVIGDLLLEAVTPHDRVFAAPPAEFDPKPVGSPCFIAKFPAEDGEEDEYYLWSLHETCRTATCGGSP